MKHCETFDHTADVGLAARADTMGELFEALAEGLADVICPRGQVEARESRQVAVTAEDAEALAVDFLSQVLKIIQTEHFMLASVRVREVSPAAVKAELSGQPYDPSRHEIATEVKAVTYHRLKIAREGRLWTGSVILDV
jgi:SHS2 domain-containing protein